MRILFSSAKRPAPEPGEMGAKAIDRAGLNGNSVDDGISLGYSRHTGGREHGRDRVAPHRSVADCFARSVASGRPVVATRVGDVPEIIVHGRKRIDRATERQQRSGYGDSAFLSDANLAARCADNGLRYAREHFCFDRMMHAKLDVDLALVEANKNRRVRVPKRARGRAACANRKPRADFTRLTTS